MNMIGHQNIGVNPALMLLSAILEPAEIGKIIWFFGVDCATAVASNDHMDRHIREKKARLSGHVPS
jgi:hypothetical protein